MMQHESHRAGKRIATPRRRDFAMGSSEDVERVARELARAWPEKPTATRAKTTPLRALGENAKRVLAHCEAH